MGTGAITQYIDVAQLVLYAFWIFFFGLIFYLRREDRREGYPLENEHGPGRDPGFIWIPEPKTFVSLHDGSTVSKPDGVRDSREHNAAPTAPWPGAPIAPLSNGMGAGVGPGSYAMRADVPDLTVEGEPKIVPLRVATDFGVETRDPDPRGMEVVGCDGGKGGVVRDIWVDRSDIIFRYLEVETITATEKNRFLLPLNFAEIDAARKRIRVGAIKGVHFAGVPVLKNPDQVTLLEEDMLVGYYGGGFLYADPARQEPLL